MRLQTNTSRRSRRGLQRIAFAGPVLAGVLFSSSLAAQTAAPATAEETERALEEKRKALDASESRAKSLKTDVADLDAERERLNARLVDTAALIQKSEAQLTAIEGRMSELEAQENVVRGSLGQRHGQIAKLLVALQRMGRNPPPVLITRREDALKMVRSAMLLSSAFPDLKNQALALSERLEDLVRVMTDIRTEGERLQSETDRLNEARTRLASFMEAKKLTIADRQLELAAVQSASAEISKSVTDLSELINKLDKTVTEQTGLGAYENELKARSGAPHPEPAASAPATPFTVASDAAPVPPTEKSAAETPDAGKVPSGLTTETKVAILQPPKLKPNIIELAPSHAALMPGSPGRIKPAIPFSTARAKLPLPAQGRRMLTFGERTQYGGQSKGMVIETRSGGQVVAPCDGWVVYAGEFRSYGQLLIINAGDGYHILLAGMSQIDVQPGQFVLTAEPVGTMSGRQTTSPGSSQSNAPVLYIEFRKDGRPIDPDPWWIHSQQKVQG